MLILDSFKIFMVATRKVIINKNSHFENNNDSLGYMEYNLFFSIDRNLSFKGLLSKRNYQKYVLRLGSF